jgi:hypothetical protein
MVVKFRTNGPFDFTNFNYVMVFDTNCPTSDPVLCTPHANVYTTTFTNYTYAFVVGTQGGTSSVSPLLYQFYIVPGGGSGLHQNITIPSAALTSLQLNTNGQNTEFTLTFNRQEFLQTPPVTGAPSPAPLGLIYLNLLTTNPPTASVGPNVPQDALGLGVNDTSFQLVLDTTQSGTLAVVTRPGGVTYPSNPAAAISGVEVDNYP